MNAHSVKITYLILKRETDKAYEIIIDGRDESVWIPKDECKIFPDKKEIFLSEWIAHKKGITSETNKEYLCDECEQDAYIGYTNWSDADGNLIVKPDERLCKMCFDIRVGEK